MLASLLALSLAVTPVADSGRNLTLKRDGAQIVIVDDRSHAIVASAPAAETNRVIVRGASGSHDDTLTVDLSQPFSLSGGIDYDGGSGGWDTLVIAGGAVRKQTVTQLTPHDGVLELDGLMLRYTNLEPVTDTAAAATLIITGTAGADTVTISDGPAAGQATISSPTFESYTFSNKTSVTYDSGGGADTFTFNNPTRPTGLTTFMLNGVATVGQTAPFDYPSLGILATGTINLTNVGNDVDNIELDTVNGSITYRDVDDVTVGGVGAYRGLHVEDTGSINFVTGGTMTLADTTDIHIVQPGMNGGDVFLQALGANSDITVTVLLARLTQADAGSVELIAGRDILLGTVPGSEHDIFASGFVSLTAASDIEIGSFTVVRADGVGTEAGSEATASAGEDFVLRDNAVFGTGGVGNTNVFAIGSVSILSTDLAALHSGSGGVNIITDRLIIGPGAGITASFADIGANTVPLDLGSTSDVGAALEISNAEINRIHANAKLVRAAVGDGVTVTQPFGTGATLNVWGDSFTATGTGSISAPILDFIDQSAVAKVWTISGTQVQAGAGAPIPISTADLEVRGSQASDTFNVTPAVFTHIAIVGGLPVPPALPGDTLSVNTAGTTSPFLTYTSSPDGYAGSYTFSNRSPVAFQAIETLAAATTDLAVTKTDGGVSATPGDTVTYMIVASNAGPLGLAGASVVDTFPAALTNVTWTCAASAGSSCTAAGSGDINQLVNLAAAGTATFSVTGTIDPSATGTLDNTVTITPPAGADDSNPANNSATDSDALAASADLSVTKTSTQTTYVPGGTLTYTIAVTNAGPSDATDVTVEDVLPANTTFASLTAAAGYNCVTPAAGATGTVTCTAASIAPATTGTFTLIVNVNLDATGSISNTATVASSTPDPNLANGTSTASAAATPAGVPTLSEGLLMMLAVLLAFTALRRM
ncbi:MAG: hypothetical protein ACJ74H_21940 [Thermoanaerobaculia bacterium]